MLKLAILIFVAFICSIHASTCPAYSSIQDFDPSKIYGEWYLLASSSEGANPQVKCAKLNFTMTGSSIQSDIQAIAIDGSPIKMTNTYTPDQNHLGDLITEYEIEDDYIFTTERHNIKLRSSVVYTDYTNILASFACYETRESLLPKANRAFTIMVRDRKFDSLSKFGSALSALVELGVDINDLRFMYNGPNCSN